MIKALVNFFMYQTKVELLMCSFFLTLLVYMVIVFVLKQKNKKVLGIYMLKRKTLFCGITYLILITYLVIGCLVLKIVENIVVYLGCMLVAAIAVNLLFILGYGVKKVKDIEFADAVDVYDEIIEYTAINDLITDEMSSYVTYLGCVDEDEINNMDFKAFTSHWLACITEYLDQRIKEIDYIELNKNRIVLFNYVSNIVSRYKLWYDKTNVDAFVTQLLKNEEVILTDSSRIIPIASKRFNCLVYVVGNKRIEDCDRSFIVNTYCTMALL